MLRPPIPNLQERLLVYGPMGSGKSTAWIDIAQWANRTGSDACFYVMDSDASIPMMMGDYPEVADRVFIYPTTTWEEFEGASASIYPKVRLQDWVVLDFAGEAWDKVQQWFAQKVHGKDLDELFLSARQAAKGGNSNPFEGWTDWPTINKTYYDWIDDYVKRGRGQLFSTAQAEKVGDMDSRELKSLYSAVGAKAIGQKKLGFQHHTVLLLQALRPNEIYITTVKERLKSRPHLTNQKLSSSFTVDYLINVAKWRVD
jgi:hypothetical protein